jgi:psiF repeat
LAFAGSEELERMNCKTLIVALGLAAGGAAFAAEPPAAPTATPIKHPSLKSCNREATSKQLSGKQREQFVKDCTAGRIQAAPKPPAAQHAAQPQPASH